MIKISFKTSTFWLVISMLSGCTNMQFGDVFSGYAEQMQPVRSAQFKGDFVTAGSLVTTRSESDGTYALSLLEKARLQYLAGNWSLSEATFTQAYDQVEAQRQRATLEISRGLQTVGAAVSNDNAIRYDVPLYEQSMLNSYQALNYLKQQNLEGALVEIRRANLVQERALIENKKALVNATKEMNKQGVNSSDLSKSYPSMSEIIGDLKNGFQNAYTFYLSALLYEVAGEYNDAYIDYKKALEIYPNNKYLQKDVLRLATQLGMTDDLQRFEHQFGKHEKTNNSAGQLVVIFEQGVINPKEQVSINLPIFTSRNDMRFYSVAMPTYRANPRSYSPLNLMINNQQYQSEKIVTLHSLAAKQLEDQLPAIVARQVVRLISKEEIRQQLSRKGGDVGNILASIYSVASEKADTRSWSTLPDNIQIIRLDVPEGKHKVTFVHQGQRQELTVDIVKGRINLVNLAAMGNFMGMQSINL